MGAKSGVSRFLDDHVAAVLRDATCPLSTKEVGAAVGRMWFANLRDSLGNVGKFVDIGSFDQDVWRSLTRLTRAGHAEHVAPPDRWTGSGARYWQRTARAVDTALSVTELPPIRTTTTRNPPR